MPRYRPIKLYGNTYVITLTREDIKDFNKKIGDEVDVEKNIKGEKKMTGREKFFKFCEVKSCGIKFKPIHDDTKKCPKCAQKIFVLRRIERINNSIKNVVSLYNLLDNMNKNNLIKISKELEKQIKQLKEELKK